MPTEAKRPGGDDPVLVEVDGRVAVVPLNRPDARNALSSALLRALRATLSELDADDRVDAIVLTGADPAFCAGLDLKELEVNAANLSTGDAGEPDGAPWPELAIPVIGAVNGPAVTGGLEVALHCDVLIASRRARFADTHARVGVLPGWGLSVLLPLAVGRGMARRMSLTGDYVAAEEALRCGLVTEVVEHDRLLATARGVAGSISGNDREAVRTLLGSYREIERALVAGGPAVEARTAREWLSDRDPQASVADRRAGVLTRGREQNAGSVPGWPLLVHSRRTSTPRILDTEINYVDARREERTSHALVHRESVDTERVRASW